MAGIGKPSNHRPSASETSRQEGQSCSSFVLERKSITCEFSAICPLAQPLERQRLNRRCLARGADYISDPYGSSAHDIRAQAAAMDQAAQGSFDREFFQMRAWIAQPRSAQHDLSY